MAHSGVGEAVAAQMRMMGLPMTDRQRATYEMLMGIDPAVAAGEPSGLELGWWSDDAEAIAKQYGVDPRDVEQLLRMARGSGKPNAIAEQIKLLAKQKRAEPVREAFAQGKYEPLNRKQRRARKARERRAKR